MDLSELGKVLDRLHMSTIVFKEDEVIHVSDDVKDFLAFKDTEGTVKDLIDDENVVHLLLEHIEKVRSGKDIEQVLYFPGGNINFPIALNSFLLDDQIVISIVDMYYNITRITRSYAYMGLSIPGIVHNLSSPLTVALNKLQMFKMKGIESEGTNEIIAELRKIQRILENISHKSIKERNEDFDSIDINKLIVTNMEYLNANSYIKHEIEKELSLKIVPKVIFGRFIDLSQIFLAFFYIVVKSMEGISSKKLKIETGYEDGKVLIKFESNGRDLSRIISDNIDKSVKNLSFCEYTKKHFNLDWSLEGLSGLMSKYEVEYTYQNNNRANTLILKFPCKSIIL